MFLHLSDAVKVKSYFEAFSSTLVKLRSERVSRFQKMNVNKNKRHQNTEMCSIAILLRNFFQLAVCSEQLFPFS